jgi:hypothetical protein
MEGMTAYCQRGLFLPYDMSLHTQTLFGNAFRQVPPFSDWKMLRLHVQLDRSVNSTFPQRRDSRVGCVERSIEGILWIMIGCLV